MDEAADIVREVDGFDFVVAADGPILPRLEPLEVNGVPIHYSGRGARFSWRVVLADNEDLAQANLSRIGGRITAMGSPYNSRMAALRRLLRRDILPTAADGPDERPIDPRGEYAGTKECAECHAEQAAAHAESDHAAVIATYLADDFSGSTGCAGCHVTAPYHRGGWAPEEDDRGMGGIGCEACHGPGADHVASPTPGYGAVNLARCYDCHLPDRTPGFDAAASWAVTAHGALPPPPAPPSNDDDARRDDDPPKDDDSDADDPARDDPARDD